jgi:hypothetical protein
MAKLPSRTELTSLADGDLFHTVDVSDTTNDATGTSKKVTAANVKAYMGLGSMAGQSASSVSITGGSVTGITDLAVADGGTGASSASAARTNLGLEIGTNVQAYDAATAYTDTAHEWTATQNFNATTLTDAANISWNAAANQVCSVTLTDNRTLDNPTNMVDGGTYILRVIQDAGGGNTLAYGNAYLWPGGVAPVLSTAGDAVDILTFVSNGSVMYGVAQLDFS